MNERIKQALEIAQDGGFDGAHHKMWVIDQMVRALTGCPVVEKTGIGSISGEPFTYQTLGESNEYRAWVAAYEQNGAYEWDRGIAP